jgi:diguanylate cyclase (GGDEF)-like protein
MRTIKGFILVAAVVASVALFLGIYAFASHIYFEKVRSDAHQQSRVLAQQTFNAMFQIMRQGWTRSQVEAFLEATRQSYSETPYDLEIYRGPIVRDKFGTIDQPVIDGEVARAFDSGERQKASRGNELVYAYPLKARNECLKCHTNAEPGDVLGAIEVRQDIGPYLSQARSELLWSLAILTPIPVLAAGLVAWLLGRRIDSSVAVLDNAIEQVNSVSDLRDVEIEPGRLGFAELDSLAGKVSQLAGKLQNVAVDKDLLEFEIRLLEKFVITSDVVQDWRQYIKNLLFEINTVLDAYVLFSLFKVEEEYYDVEVFWLQQPSEHSVAIITEGIRSALAENPHFGEAAEIEINHNVAEPSQQLPEISKETVDLQTKALLLESPKIGGIVGIGVHSATAADPTRLLVTESILSTLLNVVGSVRAISKYTKDLEYYASRDPLTDLYNQRTFRELLAYEVDRAQRNNYRFGLLVVDLDNFKTINDTYGHNFGDRFLTLFADALRGALRQGDVLARYGGDEFVIMLPETGAEQTEATADSVLAAADSVVLEAPDGTTARATASIGVAIYPDHAADANDVFMFADNMMYRAKSDGKNRIGMPTEEDVIEVFREMSEKGLVVREAVENKRVIPYYQPIMDTADGCVAAHEVLSRIRGSDDTILGAGEFIEHAERLGMVHQLDYLVMEQAFADAQASGYDGLLFINLSPRALVLQEFFDRTRALVAEYDMPPERVVFELTERETVRNISVLEQFVKRLKQDGFQFAVDDFGSGFASFHYLKRFPIDFLKIEGDFIANMVRDSRDHAFVKSMATLAAELNIHTVAEFIEDAEILAAVRSVGHIQYAQGFHLARPGPELYRYCTSLEG